MGNLLKKFFEVSLASTVILFIDTNSFGAAHNKSTQSVAAMLDAVQGAPDVTESDVSASKKIVQNPPPSPKAPSEVTANANANLNQSANADAGIRQTNDRLTTTGASYAEATSLVTKFQKKSTEIITERSGRTENQSGVGLEQLNRDIDINNRLNAAIKDGKPFSEDQALSIADPATRNSVYIATTAENAKVDLKAEHNRLSEQLAALAQLGAVALQRGNSMQNVDNQQGNIRTPSSANGLDGSQSSVSVSNLNDEKNNSNKSNSVDGKISKESAAAAAIAAAALAKAKKVADYRKALSNSLRDRLAKNDAIDSTGQFKGQLTGSSDGNGQSSMDESRIDPVEQKKNEGIGSILKSAESYSPFSMSGTETSAEVQRLMTEGERALASLAQDGVMSDNSASLFERVKKALTSCARSKCVSVTIK